MLFPFRPVMVVVGAWWPLDFSKQTNIVDVANAIGVVAIPIAAAYAVYKFQKIQKVAEAAFTERITRVGKMSPLLNTIFSYRQRVGDFLDRAPEDILEAKRQADKEFWTFEYLWSATFKRAYHTFMHESFEMNRGEGVKAGIRAESQLYPKKATMPGWVAFTEKPVSLKRNKELYDALQSAIARDIGFKRG